MDPRLGFRLLTAFVLAWPAFSQGSAHALAQRSIAQPVPSAVGTGTRIELAVTMALAAFVSKLPGEYSNLKMIISFDERVVFTIDRLNDYVFQGHRLSPRLSKILMESGIKESDVVVAKGTAVNFYEDGVTLSLFRESATPIAITRRDVPAGAEQFPRIDLLRGEVGIRKGEFFVTELTQVRIGDRIYTFTMGTWT